MKENIFETGGDAYRGPLEDLQMRKISKVYMDYQELLQKNLANEGNISKARVNSAKATFLSTANEMLEDDSVGNEIKNHVRTLLEEIGKNR